MPNNVIYVDFSKPKLYGVDRGLQDYLKELEHLGICQEDIEDIANAINDYECYNQSDWVIKEFVDEWFVERQNDGQAH